MSAGPEETAAAGELSILAYGVLWLGLGLSTSSLGARLGRRLTPAAPALPARWGFLEVALAVAVAIAVAAVVPGSSTLGVLWRSAAMLGAATAVALWVARRRGALPAMGLARGGSVRSAAVALLRYVLFLPAWMGVVLLWPLLAGRLGLDVRPQPVLQGLLELRGAALWQGILLAILVVPFFEEAIFRGFLQPVAERRLGSGRGVVLTSLLFALLHGIAFGPIFAFSLLLGSIQVQGRRLTAAWLIHGLHNAGMLALAFQSSALREFLSRP